MPLPDVGDLFTFPLRGGRFGIGHVLHVDDFALHNIYHVAVHDAVIGGTEGGFDSFGEPLPREHDPAEYASSATLIHHIGLTVEALLASDPVVVGLREIEDDALAGYRAWLDRRYQDAVRSGMLRVRSEREDEEEYGEDLEEGEDEAGDGEDARSDDEESGRDVAEQEAPVDADGSEPDGPNQEDGGAESAEYELVGVDEDAPETVEQRRALLSFGVVDLPLGVALLQYVDALEEEHFREAALARHLRDLVSGGDAGIIRDLVEQFVQGDYGAGQELLEHGRPAVEALASLLVPDVPSELADDVLQILGSSGDLLAYEKIAEFFGEHSSSREDPLYAPAVRGFCYVVMLTEGDPDPVRERLGALDEINDPDLAEDVRTARSAASKWR